MHNKYKKNFYFNINIYEKFNNIYIAIDENA